jgi:L,D-peptidoglycan transpeptidase YkuD (ErfK/YbiS/YcfS/YnhG family)
VVRSRARKVARFARWTTALAAAALLLGVGTPVLGAPVDAAVVHPDEGMSPAGRDALAASAAEVTAVVPALHPSVPRGYRAPAPATAAPRPRAASPAVPAPSRAGTDEPAVQPAPDPASVPEAPAPSGTTALPLPVAVGRSTQVVTVVAPSAGSTRATLTAWQLGPGGWTVAAGPVAARVGAQGVGGASETTSRTPAGTFTLTEGFGRRADPGTRLPYRVIDSLDWWVSDVRSGLYNQHARCAPRRCGFDESAGENLASEGWVYDHALVIDYNRRPAVPGAGSAFFLHVTNGAPTAGCVAIDDASLTAIMRWLDPAARPLIAIGVG